MEAYVPVQLILNCRTEVSVATVHVLFLGFGSHQAELIGSITYIDEKMSTSGLSDPLRDLFEGPLSELLSELKNHHEMISVLTEWAAQAGLHIPTDSNPTRNDLHPIFTSHRGDTHPTVQEGTLPPTNPPTPPPPPLPSLAQARIDGH